MPLLREGEITTVDFCCTNSSKDKQIPGFGQQPAELFSSYILLALIPALLSYPLQLSAVTTVGLRQIIDKCIDHWQIFLMASRADMACPSDVDPIGHPGLYFDVHRLTSLLLDQLLGLTIRDTSAGRRVI
jgi:hypothetical protein